MQDGGARPRAGVATLGLGLFLAWQMASLSLLFPSSAFPGFSPLALSAFSVVALGLLCYYSYRRDAGSFTGHWLRWLAAIAAAGSSVAGLLLMLGTLPVWGVYGAAAIFGLSSAMMMLVWALLCARLSGTCCRTLAFGSLALGCAVDYAVMVLGGDLIPFILVGCLIGSWACLMVALGSVPEAQRPLLVRPTRTRDFLMLAVGVVLFAIALGIVGGTTARVSTPESMGELNADVALSGVVVAAIAAACCGIGGRRVDPITLLKVFVPCVIVVMLANIMDYERSQFLLTLTLSGWPFLLICLFLLIVQVDRVRILSIPLGFPVGWALAWSGFGVGVVLGQNAFPLASADVQAMTNSIIVVVVLAVISSVLLLSNDLVVRLRADVPPVLQSEAAEGEPRREAEELEEDGLERCCGRLADFYHLSAREAEVFVLLAQGHTRASIAKKLFVSENTVRDHAKSIYRKLSIHSRQQLIDLVDARR